MSRPLPPHGRRARYLKGCPCTRCYDANRNYLRDYRKLLKETGLPGMYVDPEPARRHLEALLEQGYTWRQLAARAGVNVGTFRGVLRQRHPRAHRDVADAFLALTPELLGAPNPNGWVNASLTHQRVRSLMALGHTAHWIAREVGHSDHGWTFDREQVRVQLATSVLAAYRRWSDTPGRPDKAAEARARGFQLPIDWDDPETLAWPPGEEPAGLAAQRLPASAVKGTRNAQGRADRLKAVRKLVAAGLNDVDIARRLQVSPNTARKDRLSLGVISPYTAAVSNRVEAIRQAAAEGLSDPVIASRLGISPRTVVRLRGEHGIPAAIPASRRSEVA